MLLCFFSEEQMMKKGSKADLGTYLKNFGSSSVTSVNDNIPLIIDGGWLHPQILALSKKPDTSPLVDISPTVEVSPPVD